MRHCRDLPHTRRLAAALPMAAPTASMLIERLKELGECAICFHTYSASGRQAHSLMCGHVMCATCLNQLLSGRGTGRGARSCHV